MHRLGVALVAVGIMTACADSDVGRCCEVIAGTDPSIIPTGTVSVDQDFINDIAQDPAFLCEALTCVAYRGSEPYCTAPCQDDEDCPVGFVCERVLVSDPGPNAPIQRDDRFCLRPRDQARCER